MKTRRARLRAGRLGLAVALVLVAVFTVWPELDLWTSAQFRDAGGTFTGNGWTWVRVLYRGIPVSGWLMGLAGLAVLLAVRRTGSRNWRWLRSAGAWIRRRRIFGRASAGIGRRLYRAHPLGYRWSRRLVALTWVSLLGSLLVVNLGFKEYWGRARPVQVTQFGGTRQFSPPLAPASQCSHNCSFVSGHAASGFVIMAVGLMGSVATRRRWLIAGLAWGGIASLARIMQGGHFLSDTLFAGVAIWATGWIVRELWLRHVALRWRRLRLRDGTTARRP
jgi:lipid A 4'-phosphatase